jgi:hypothetical protein
MSMQITCVIQFDVELFQLEEVARAERLAQETSGHIYSWKTTERSNWLERGLSIADVLGLIVLPNGLPTVVEMADDQVEDE